MGEAYERFMAFTGISSTCTQYLIMKLELNTFIRKRIYISVTTLLAALQLVFCYGNRPPSVEKIIRGTASVLPLQLVEMSGLRDGYYVDSTILFTRNAAPSAERIPGDIDSLILEVRIEAAVPSKFISGLYRMFTPGEIFRGRMKCPSLNFHGGQGGLPGLGGVFEFKNEIGDFYRVYLPSTELMRK